MSKRCLAGLQKSVVAANVIGICAGIDDESNGRRRDRPDGRHHVIELVSRAGIDENDTVDSHLHGDVGTRASDHVEVRPYPQDLELGRVPEGSPLLLGIPRSALDAYYAQHDQNCRDARRDTLHVNLLVATDSEDQVWLDKIC